jgi:hypothetical protein
MTYYVLKALSWAGLVWDIQTPPAKIVDGTAKQHVPAGSVAKKITEPVPVAVESAAE